MTRGNFVTWKKAPTPPPTETGRQVFSPLMFPFQRDGSQVLKKDDPHKAEKGLFSLLKNIYTFQREENVQVF